MKTKRSVCREKPTTRRRTRRRVPFTVNKVFHLYPVTPTLFQGPSPYRMMQSPRLRTPEARAEIACEILGKSPSKEARPMASAHLLPALNSWQCLVFPTKDQARHVGQIPKISRVLLAAVLIPNGSAPFRPWFLESRFVQTQPGVTAVRARPQP